MAKRTNAEKLEALCEKQKEARAREAYNQQAAAMQETFVQQRARAQLQELSVGLRKINPMDDKILAATQDEVRAYARLPHLGPRELASLRRLKEAMEGIEIEPRWPTDQEHVRRRRIAKTIALLSILARPEQLSGLRLLDVHQMVHKFLWEEIEGYELFEMTPGEREVHTAIMSGEPYPDDYEPHEDYFGDARRHWADKLSELRALIPAQPLRPSGPAMPIWDAIKRDQEERKPENEATPDQDGQWRSMGYTDLKRIGDRWSAIITSAHGTYSLVYGDMTKGPIERWVYVTWEGAKAAMDAWDFYNGSEPEGWHRHPTSRRRRPGGNKAEEYIEEFSKP